MTTAASHALHPPRRARTRRSSAAEIAVRARAAARSSSTRRFEIYRPDPDYPVAGRRPSTGCASSPAHGARRSGRAGSSRASGRPTSSCPASTSTAGSASARPTSSPRSGTSRPGRKYFGTFIEYTALVGALGYAQAVQLLRGARLICIDEFELDDPGDTMLMTRLLGELVAGGTRIAATSNTPPNALGEGRFAAADFLREIHALSSNVRDAAHRRPRLPPPRHRGPRRGDRRRRGRARTPPRRSPAAVTASRSTASTSSSRTSRPCTRRSTSSSSTARGRSR